MNCGFLVNSSPYIASVINLMGWFQVLITDVCPGFPPEFDILSLVPVVRRDRNSLPELFSTLAFSDPDLLLSGFRINDWNLIARLIQLQYGLFFFAPSAIWIELSCGKHDMSMGVPVSFVMDRHIGTHTPGSKLVFYILTDNLDLQVSVKLLWQSDIQ